MQDILINKLHAYLEQNNPDILMSLEVKSDVTKYLSGKLSSVEKLIDQLQSEGHPPYLIEEICMDVLTKDLKPSRFNYICSVLNEDFADTYQKLQESGTLKLEGINVLRECEEVFEAIGFTEDNEDSRQLRYAITGTISEYLAKQM